MTILVAGEVSPEALTFLQKHGVIAFRGQLRYLNDTVYLYFVVLPEPFRMDTYEGVQYTCWFEDSNEPIRTEGIVVDHNIDVLKTKINYITFGDSHGSQETPPPL